MYWWCERPLWSHQSWNSMFAWMFSTIIINGTKTGPVPMVRLHDSSMWPIVLDQRRSLRENAADLQRIYLKWIIKPCIAEWIMWLQIEVCCTCKYFFPHYIEECDVQRACVCVRACVCKTTADMIRRFPGDVLFSAFCHTAQQGTRTAKLWEFHLKAHGLSLVLWLGLSLLSLCGQYLHFGYFLECEWVCVIVFVCTCVFVTCVEGLWILLKRPETLRVGEMPQLCNSRRETGLILTHTCSSVSVRTFSDTFPSFLP